MRNKRCKNVSLMDGEKNSLVQLVLFLLLVILALIAFAKIIHQFT